jgi:hypothetical protein
MANQLRPKNKFNQKFSFLLLLEARPQNLGLCRLESATRSPKYPSKHLIHFNSRAQATETRFKPLSSAAPIIHPCTKQSKPHKTTNEYIAPSGDTLGINSQLTHQTKVSSQMPNTLPNGLKYNQKWISQDSINRSHLKTPWFN